MGIPPGRVLPFEPVGKLLKHDSEFIFSHKSYFTSYMHSHIIPCRSGNYSRIPCRTDIMVGTGKNGQHFTCLLKAKMVPAIFHDMSEYFYYPLLIFHQQRKMCGFNRM